MSKDQGYQPKTGVKCGCRRGVQRDNCPNCEGTGMVVDFAAIRARLAKFQVWPCQRIGIEDRFVVAKPGMSPVFEDGAFYWPKDKAEAIAAKLNSK